MKKIFYSIMAAVLVFAGCNERTVDLSGNMGSLSLDLSYDGSDYITRAASVDVDDFSISIVRTSDGWTKSYAKYSDVPQLIELAPGVYTITAQSAEVQPAAFDQPVYGGSVECEIVAGEVVPLQIICTLQNMKVSFVTTEKFSSEIIDYTVTVSNGIAPLVWRKAEIEAGAEGYFSVGTLEIHIDGYRAVDNSEVTFDGIIENVAARDHHIITLDAAVTGAVQSMSIVVDLATNDKTTDIFIPGWEEIPVPGDTTGKDEPVEPEDPELPGDGNSSEVTLSWPENPSLDIVDIHDGMSVSMTVTAPAGIKDFIVTVTSDTQGFLELVSLMTSNPQSAGNIESVELDLINDQAAVSSMRGIGLTTGEDLVGATEVPFELSNLVPMIPSAGQAGPDTYHYFTLTVTDVNGETSSWDLGFHVPAN